MAVQDTDLLTELQLVLQEDGTFSNGIWLLQEVLGYANQRQMRFLKDTGIISATWAIPWIPGEILQPLPGDWVRTITVLWHDLLSDKWTPLPSSDSFEFDHVNIRGYTTPGFPQAYRDADTPTLTLGIEPPPAAPGEIELIGIPLSEVLDGSGIFFTVPDEWVPYLKYGVYADMLGKDGRGQDLLRARYAEQRYTEGVALAAALVEGFY